MAVRETRPCDDALFRRSGVSYSRGFHFTFTFTFTHSVQDEEVEEAAEGAAADCSARRELPRRRLASRRRPRQRQVSFVLETDVPTVSTATHGNSRPVHSNIALTTAASRPSAQTPAPQQSFPPAQQSR